MDIKEELSKWLDANEEIIGKIYLKFDYDSLRSTGYI